MISLNFTITIKLFCLLQTQSLGACVLYRTHGRFTLVNQPPRSHNVLSRQHGWLPTWLWSSVINRRRTTEEGKWHSFITHISYIHLLECRVPFQVLHLAIRERAWLRKKNITYSSNKEKSGKNIWRSLWGTKLNFLSSQEYMVATRSSTLRSITMEESSVMQAFRE